MPRLLDAALRGAGPMYIADGDGRLVMTNPAFDDLLAAGFGDRKVSRSGRAPGALREIFRRLENGDGDGACDDTLAMDGGPRRFRSSHHRIEDADGGIGFSGHYIEVARDSDAAAAAKNAFLGKMSHEMRTPLTAIIGFAEMSESQPFGPLDRRYVAYLRNIGTAERHLSGMIGDLLELASVTAEAPDNDGATVAVAESLAAAKAAVADLAARRGIDIGAVETGRGWCVVADHDRLRRICVNLLDNAVKYTEPGGRVGVEVMRAEPPGMVEITFWDTGIGIAADRIEHIFESFHQVDPDRLHQRSDGAGLGLAVSRHLARMMGGDLRVDSPPPGESARFTLSLPAAGGD
jgi:signal transduction histidine kinase